MYDPKLLYQLGTRCIQSRRIRVSICQKFYSYNPLKDL